MKNKYITLEEALALRGTDTKIYDEDYEEFYYKYNGDILCLYTKEGTLDEIGVSIGSFDKHYILEPEEFKVEKTGLYKTRDGQTVFISVIDEDSAYGVVENSNFIRIWYISGEYAECAKDTHLDLVERI